MNKLAWFNLPGHVTLTPKEVLSNYEASTAVINSRKCVFVGSTILFVSL
jgi:hypothetical protein